MSQVINLLLVHFKSAKREAICVQAQKSKSSIVDPRRAQRASRILKQMCPNTEGVMGTKYPPHSLEGKRPVSEQFAGSDQFICYTPPIA